LWNYCRLRANHSDRTTDFNGKPFVVKRGSFITSIRKLSKKTGLSEQNIKTAIKTLVAHEMLAKSTQLLTQNATLITIVNYDFYNPRKEDTNTDSNTQPTHSQHTPNEQLTTNKNVKELSKNEKKEDISVKKDPTEKHYSKSFLKLWIDYPNATGSKTQTFKNYKKTITVFSWSDKQIYEAAMKSAKKQKSESKTNDVYYNKLSNVIGDKYRNDLPEILESDIFSKEENGDAEQERFRLEAENEAKKTREYISQ